MNIPKDKFQFIHEGERLRDKKFDDKPIGYFKDAWIRFRKRNLLLRNRTPNCTIRSWKPNPAVSLPMR